jgi:transcriptional activator SPT7
MRFSLIHSGTFADELGEDFFGLRELGLDREFDIKNLSIPSSLLYGKRRNHHGLPNGHAQPQYEYAPPPSLIPLTPSEIPSLPGLLQAYYNSRIDSLDDDVFDHTHSQIGSLGQITQKSVVKKPPKPPKKFVTYIIPNYREGVGRGNWSE